MRPYFYKLSVTQILNPSLPFPRNQLLADGPGGQEQRSHPSSRELRFMIEKTMVEPFHDSNTRCVSSPIARFKL